MRRLTPSPDVGDVEPEGREVLEQVTGRRRQDLSAGVHRRRL